jgi:Domain of unknown function (DUF6766)
MSKQTIRDHGLTIALIALFLAAFVGQIATGYRVYNQERKSEDLVQISLFDYLSSGHFIEATAENWESEYLQLTVYVVLTAVLFQRGSAESRDPDRPDSEMQDGDADDSRSQWAVRKGGFVLTLYSYSLTIVLMLLFLLSFLGHLYGGARLYSEEQVAAGQSSVSIGRFLETSDFWFQSLQNWQSEFLAVGSIVVLTIFLRHKGSPESKSLDSPNSQTGK